MHNVHGIRSLVANLIERTLKIHAARVSPAHIAEMRIEAIRIEVLLIRTTGIGGLHRVITGMLGRDLVLQVGRPPADNHDQHLHIVMPINVPDRRNARQDVARRNDK